MTNEERKQDMLNYFNERIFEPALIFSQENNVPEIAKGTRYTKMRMEQLEPRKILQYFWSAIVGTERSIEFARLLKDNNVVRFEDIIDEVRIKFNDEYFRD